ncbi:MAG TPA: ribosome silencing factor [Planctomycetota bacterium]|nr:ribosome silencing factor [Planctomycetota bacterium]
MKLTDAGPSKEAKEGATRFAQAVLKILDEKRAEDIVWLDVRGVTDVADEFLIATIMNPRQGGAILDACEKEAKRLKVSRLGVEGGPQSTWILLDYGSLVVHLFLPEQRAYYGLEHIWSDAKRKDIGT